MPPTTNSPVWIIRLRELLCAIYQEWGGDCADLGVAPTAWIDTVTSAYVKNGAPTFADDAAQMEFLDTVGQLETHLASPDNSLTAEDNARLTTLIAALRNDLGSSVASASSAATRLRSAGGQSGPRRTS
jgi:hypothetical protein